ncbi:hypothetical protein PVAND_006076 [Polypedilum vanderplanki]|uniref:Regulator of microtubule dynamics protein 1 n=1 Tax=Polypedilum vanderplanki TaxID=319348 RepID=A0A9J6C332_POLVA|nr:hypothetical protein PVAND_006076 [Polypedilum vanderplanki]
MVEIETILLKSDVMFLHEYRLQETLDLLKTLDQTNVQVLYRLVRCCYQMSKRETKRNVKTELIKNAFQYAQDALKIDNECSEVHAWYAVALDTISEFNGIKERIMKLKDVKYHMMKAIELNPKEPIPFYIYGLFHFGLAELAWYEKLILESIICDPPVGSYEKALESFLQAEKNQPNFYSVNKLMIAKCFIALKNYEKAEVYLKLAVDIQIKNDDDAECHEESKKLLNKIKKYL